MFQGNLALAYLFIKIASAVILFILALAFVLKIRLIRMDKKKKEVLKKYEAYFHYVQAHLDGPEPLRKPVGQPTAWELTVISDKFSEWIQMLYGSQQEKLIELSEQMGLVDMNLRLLNSRFSWRRSLAAFRLGKLRSKKAYPFLLKRLLKEKYGADFIICARAAAMCARDSNDLSELAHIFAKQKKNVGMLAADILTSSPQFEPDIVKDWLMSKDFRLLKIALHSLKGHAVAHLAPMLQELTEVQDKEVRILAVERFLYSIPDLTQDIVYKLLNHPDKEVRAITAKAVGMMGDAANIEMLKQAMTDPDWLVKHHSAKSLSMLGEEGFSALCEVAVHSEDAFTRDMANDVIHEEIMAERSHV